MQFVSLLTQSKRLQELTTAINIPGVNKLVNPLKSTNFVKFSR